jgi:hypothetical protein
MDGAGCDGVCHEGRSRKYTMTGCPDLFNKYTVNQLKSVLGLQRREKRGGRERGEIYVDGFG